ncbi:MAG: HIT family protein [Patescibacteria group bacterium]
MIDCLFCKIIEKTIPSVGVYEDEDVYAFLDIKPVNPGHVLVVPKMHSEGFHDANPEVLKKWIVATQKISKAIMVALGTEGFNLELNNGAIAGQLIPHLHIHIIPRRLDDGLKHWPGVAYESGKDIEIAEAIKKEL